MVDIRQYIVKYLREFGFDTFLRGNFLCLQQLGQLATEGRAIAVAE